MEIFHIDKERQSHRENRRPIYDISANVRSLSEQPFGFTMHYNGHRESTYVMVNRRKNVAKHLSGTCRVSRQFMQIIET